MADTLVETDELEVKFPVRQGVFSRVSGYVRAVDGVSLKLKRGETFGLVGESGCGKTTLGRAILALLKPTGGRVIFDGTDISLLSRRERRESRRRMQPIFQDPFDSLNPRLTVGGTIGEPLSVHKAGNRRERRRRVQELLERVGLPAAAVNRYPHEFSGGQRQRIGIARALALEPEFVVCDEPVSALDVSIQAQIINLLGDLQGELGLTYLFIAHDLAVVRHISNRVGVMYLGKIVEQAETEKLFRKALHPYTRLLLDSIPVPDPRQKKSGGIRGGEEAGEARVEGCRFRPRCKVGDEKCEQAEPPLVEVRPGHYVACFKVENAGAEE